jgi:hypothetical protein
LEDLVSERFLLRLLASEGYSRIAYFLLSNDEVPEKALHFFELDKISKRQSWFMQLRHAECVAVLGDMSKAFEMINKIYTIYPESVNGYAAIAWHLRKNTGRLKSPWALAKRDLDSKRISPGFLLNVAELAMIEEFPDESCNLIEKAYDSDPKLTDGYARCGWAYYWSKWQHKKIIDWIERDRSKNRLSPEWHLKKAQAHAALGEFDSAVLQVKNVYADYPELTDGYARCAWYHFWPKRKYGKIIEWMHKDENNNRLTPFWRLKLAESYAANGEFDLSVQQVDLSYKHDYTLTDGYARCAWSYFWPKWPCGDYSPMLYWMEKDLNAHKMSPRWMLNLSQAYAALGDYAKAKNLLD